jgi:prolyl-tRNA synthetase
MPDANGFETLARVDTPDQRTIEEVTAFLNIGSEQLVKTLIYMVDEEPVAVLIRGDHELNDAKLKNALDAQAVEIASERLVEEATGAPVGFAGPVGLEIKVVADNALKSMENFVVGGNEKDLHLRNVNHGRDFKPSLFSDLRTIAPGDACPRCGGPIAFGRGIEVGHVFKLGVKYSKAMKAVFLNEQGKEIPTIMGCYGIGIGRTVAAAIEQNHDKDGIDFPIPVAPFEVTILPLQMHNEPVVEAASGIYGDLMDMGIDVLLDDRDERAGVKFKDADLLGIPVRITVGSRGLKNGEVEVKLRSEPDSFTVPLEGAAGAISDTVKGLYDSIK